MLQYWQYYSCAPYYKPPRHYYYDDIMVMMIPATKMHDEVDDDYDVKFTYNAICTNMNSLFV